MSNSSLKQGITRYVLLIVGLFAVNVFFSQLLMVTNVEIRSREIKVSQLEKDNQNLRVKLSRFESSEYITSEAKKLGFIAEPNVLYIMQNEFAQK